MPTNPENLSLPIILSRTFSVQDFLRSGHYLNTGISEVNHNLTLKSHHVKSNQMRFANMFSVSINKDSVYSDYFPSFWVTMSYAIIISCYNAPLSLKCPYTREHFVIIKGLSTCPSATANQSINIFAHLMQVKAIQLHPHSYVFQKCRPT